MTIDAMGCQKAIAASESSRAAATASIAVKDNQPRPGAAIRGVFPRPPGVRPAKSSGIGITRRSTRGTVASTNWSPGPPAGRRGTSRRRRSWSWIKAIGYSVRITRRGRRHRSPGRGAVLPQQPLSRAASKRFDRRRGPAALPQDPPEPGPLLGQRRRRAGARGAKVGQASRALGIPQSGGKNTSVISVAASWLCRTQRQRPERLAGDDANAGSAVDVERHPKKKKRHR